MLGWFFLSRRPRGVPSQVGGVTKTLQILPPPPCSTACLATHPASCHPGPPGLTQCSLINVVKMFLEKSFVFPVDLILLPTKAVSGLLLDLKGEPSVATEVKVGDLSGALYIKKRKNVETGTKSGLISRHINSWPYPLWTRSHGLTLFRPHV